MSLQNVGGVFLVLVVGSIGGIFVAFAELLCGVCKRAYGNNVPIKEELITELKFFVSCHGQTKPNTSCNKSETNEGSRKSLKSLEDQFSPTYGFIPDLQQKKSSDSRSRSSKSRRPSRLTNQRSS